MKESLRTYLDFAVEACTEAGKITLEYFQHNPEMELKQDLSPVTIADKRSEEKIRSMITKYFPDHTVIGEEFGITNSESRNRWYIDPIDGTKAYVQGVPIYGVMLGLEIDSEFIVGVVNFPALGEIAAAARGEGCYWNAKRASVSSTTNLDSALFVHSGSEYFIQTGRANAYAEFVNATAWQRTWGDCYGHILVATGRADLCVDPILNSWDAAALIPILNESGGTFTDWHGTVTPHAREGISSNQILLPAILSISSKYSRTTG
jgi:histidinol phosphatase-like enzyme (inositol monophosphatase family)